MPSTKYAKVPIDGGAWIKRSRLSTHITFGKVSVLQYRSTRPEATAYTDDRVVDCIPLCIGRGMLFPRGFVTAIALWLSAPTGILQSQTADCRPREPVSSSGALATGSPRFEP
jgi:hypothetical protein